MSDAWDFTIFVLCFFLGVATFIVVCAFPINYISYLSCKNTAAFMGVEYKYSWNTDCFINYKGEWLPYSKLNTLNIKVKDN